MDFVTVLVPVTFGGLVAYLLMRRRNEPASRTSWVPSEPLGLEDVVPGDVISFWIEGERVIETVLRCSEEVNGREVQWKLLFLDSGEIVELAPRGWALYTHGTVFRQGSREFERLTADVARGGALQTFEARVRSRTLVDDPVHVEFSGASFRITSTGCFGASVWGAPLTQPCWRDLSAEPSHNVYFTLEGAPDDVALGIWTSHVLLLRGRRLHPADVRAIYPRPEGRP